MGRGGIALSAVKGGVTGFEVNMKILSVSEVAIKGKWVLRTTGDFQIYFIFGDSILDSI